MSRGRPTFEFESAPELPGSDQAAKIGFGGIRRLVHRLWDVDVEGVENVPLSGPALITPNHLSFCDSVFVPSVLPRRVWAIGKGEYMDDWKTKYLFPALGMIPVDRGGGKAAQVALDTAARVLDGGHLFMIYPEGTRSRSGNLHKGRTGAARLAVRCNAPIIPVGHQGTVEIQPPDQFLMEPFKTCVVRIGKPIRAEDIGDPDDPRTLRAMTDEVMFRIAQLSGQTYVNTYAGKREASSDEPATRPLAPTQDTPHRPTKPAGRNAHGAPIPVATNGAGGSGRPTRPSAPTKPGAPTKPTRPSRPAADVDLSAATTDAEPTR
ncbi:MAG: 1-acyl-sn-glycerol-3-phosphate acyltransferase [Actinomycetota bacterium]